MSETQLLTAALSTAPTMIAVLIGMLLNNGRFGDLNARLGDLRADMNTRFSETNGRIEDLDKKMDQRFEDIKATWRAELHRVEEVLDARLKHLEER